MPEIERPKYGGTRVDDMIDPESLAHLIQELTPAPRMTRGNRDMGRISTDSLRQELERREGAENVGE